MRAPNGVLGGFLSAVLLSACSSGATLIVLGELPDSAESVLVALEQGERRTLFAQPVSSSSMRIEIPDEFESSESFLVTRLSYREDLAGLGVERAGLVPRAAAPNEPLSSRMALATEAALLIPDAESVELSDAEAEPWINDYPLPPTSRCLSAVPGETAVAPTSPTDLLAVRPDLAVGVGGSTIYTFEPGGGVRTFSLPGAPMVRRLGLGMGGRVWVSTSSRAFVFDPDTGASANATTLPVGVEAVGIGEDPLVGDLYVLTSSATLWRRSAGESTFEVLYQIPPDRVRFAGLMDQVTRFYFVGARHLVVMLDDVSAVIEIEGDRIRLLSGAAVGVGFQASVQLADRRVFVAESARGDLFEYSEGRFEIIGRAPTLLAGLVALDQTGRRFLYLGSSGVMGQIDLRFPTSCAEITVSAIRGPDGVVPVGHRILVRGQLAPSLYGFAWLDPEF